MTEPEHYCETKLNRTQSHNQDTGQDRDRAVPNSLRAHQTRLPRAHPVPTPSVQKWLRQIPSSIFYLVPWTHPLPFLVTFSSSFPLNVNPIKWKPYSKNQIKSRSFCTWNVHGPVLFPRKWEPGDQEFRISKKMRTRYRKLIKNDSFSHMKSTNCLFSRNEYPISKKNKT